MEKKIDGFLTEICFLCFIYQHSDLSTFLVNDIKIKYDSVSVAIDFVHSIDYLFLKIKLQ